MSTEKGQFPEKMGINSEQAESDAERELNEYGRQMEEALADLAAEKATSGQPSDVKTVLKESLIISRAFDNVIRDTENLMDIDVVQERLINPKVTMLGLDPKKFSFHKLHELIQKTEK